MKTFEEHLNAAISSSRMPKRSLADGECRSPNGDRCPLCCAKNLTYETEIPLKNDALRSFWKQRFSSIPLEPIVASPKGRGYRTVTKRRAFHVGQSLKLGLIAPSEEGPYKPFDVIRCAIEPDDHAAIYHRIQETLVKPCAEPLAEVLTYVILKGNYEERTVLFNVRRINQDVVRAVNTLSKSLTHSFRNVVGVFLYEDASSGRYYLGRGDAQSKPVLRKVFGKTEIYQRVGDRSFLYSPTAFSQINQSIVETFVDHAGTMLDLHKDMVLFDLYCGYGLFGLCMANRVRSVIGVEVSPESVAAAVANATRQKVANTRFIRSDISRESIVRIVEQMTSHSAIILDPPRSGTGEGVVEAIAAIRPKRILHIFCNIDIIEAELKRWTDNGYVISKAIPFDMFPGTASIELMILLTRT